MISYPKKSRSRWRPACLQGLCSAASAGCCGKWVMTAFPFLSTRCTHCGPASARRGPLYDEHRQLHRGGAEHGAGPQVRTRRCLSRHPRRSLGPAPEDRCHTILITSPGAGDGKTTCAPISPSPWRSPGKKSCWSMPSFITPRFTHSSDFGRQLGWRRYCRVEQRRWKRRFNRLASNASQSSPADRAAKSH